MAEHRTESEWRFDVFTDENLSILFRDHFLKSYDGVEINFGEWLWVRLVFYALLRLVCDKWDCSEHEFLHATAEGKMIRGFAQVRLTKAVMIEDYPDHLGRVLFRYPLLREDLEPSMPLMLQEIAQYLCGEFGIAYNGRTQPSSEKSVEAPSA